MPSIGKHSSRSVAKQTYEATISNSRSNDEDRNAPTITRQNTPITTNQGAINSEMQTFSRNFGINTRFNTLALKSWEKLLNVHLPNDKYNSHFSNLLLRLYPGIKAERKRSTDNEIDSLFTFSPTCLLPGSKATLCLFHQRLKMKFGSFAICEILID